MLLPIFYVRPLFAFFSAVRRGDVDRVHELLNDHPAYLSATNLYECTPLAVAAELGRKDVALFLIEQGADIDGADSFYPPLVLAAVTAQTEVGKLLIERGGDTEVRGFRHNSTPLILAAAEGNLDFVTMLISHGAEIDATDQVKDTALIAAAEMGHADVIRSLLEAGADPDKKGHRTALYYAVTNDHRAAVEALLRGGADPSTAPRYMDPEIRRLFEEAETDQQNPNPSPEAEP
jgi:ankyrin repeat protein